MSSALLKQSSAGPSREDLYAELRMRGLRRNDWCRLKRLALLLFLVALVAVGVTYLTGSDGGLLLRNP